MMAVKFISESNEILLSKGDYLKVQNGFYKYMGHFNSIKEVPNEVGLYSIGYDLFLRRTDLRRLERMKAVARPVKEVDTSDKLDLVVRPGDESTLIIIKELLKGFTKNQFKMLFDNDSDMNNIRRTIEKSENGRLTLKCFSTILEKLGLKYKIFVYYDDESFEKPIFHLEDKIKKVNEEMANDSIAYDTEKEEDEEDDDDEWES
jgi:hypothetical protein